MRNDYIMRQVRRCGRNLALAGVMIVPFPIFMVVLGIAMLVPPTPVAPSELLAVPRARKVLNPAVLLTTDAAPIETGITYKGNDRVLHRVVLIPIEDHYLVTFIPVGYTDRVYKGHFRSPSSRDDAALVQELTQGDERTRALLLPERLWIQPKKPEDTVYPIVLLLMGVVCLPLGLIPLWRAGSRIINANRSPIVRRFKQWGDAENALASLNGEMAQGLARRLGKLQYTPSWLVNEMLFDVDIARVDDIVWLYKVVAPGVEGGVTAAIRLRTKSGFSVIGGHSQVEDMLAILHERVPWAFLGWTAELDLMWRVDRPGLIRLVEQRYQQYLSPFGLKAAENPSQSSPDERIQKPDDGIKPAESSSSEDLTNE